MPDVLMKQDGHRSAGHVDAGMVFLASDHDVDLIRPEAVDRPLRIQAKDQLAFIDLVRRRLENSRLVAHHMARNLNHRKSLLNAKAQLSSMVTVEGLMSLLESARLFRLKANVAFAEMQCRASDRDLASCRAEIEELDRLIEISQVV